MSEPDDEEGLLRSVALRNAQAILRARQRAEEELIRTKEALELKTRQLEAAGAEAAAELSERQRVEVALRASERSFALLAELVPQLMWAARPDGAVEYFNQRWYEYTGQAPGEALEHGWAETLHPDDRERTWERWRRARETGEPVEVEYRLRRADGEYRWFLARGVPLKDGHGRVEQWFGTCTDIQERKQLEAALQEADHRKDEFLATLSHELRTPLNAILGWTRLLQSGGLDAPTHQRALETIERNTRAQAQLVEDLLDVSRIVSGTLRVDLRSAELRPIIEAAVDAVASAARARQIRIDLHLDPWVGPVLGDADRLQQVVWNLLSNAIKFTPEGGAVEVSLRREDPGVALGVRDTGRGISADFLPHVFERFRQAEGGERRERTGLGLGLAIVRHLIELHGGSVHAESPGEGHGATFTVRLPMPAVAPLIDRLRPSWPPGRGAPPDLSRLRILVVEDDPDGLELLTRALEAAGARVLAASSAAAARGALDGGGVDVLVSDVGMPGESGYDLIRQLRARGPGRGGRVRALALTAYASEADSQRALAAGFDSHLAKPVEPDTLLQAIASLVHRPGEDFPAER